MIETPRSLNNIGNQENEDKLESLVKKIINKIEKKTKKEKESFQPITIEKNVVERFDN